jgi:hypothetical protein
MNYVSCWHRLVGVACALKIKIFLALPNLHPRADLRQNRAGCEESANTETINNGGGSISATENTSLALCRCPPLIHTRMLLKQLSTDGTPDVYSERVRY